MVVLSQAADLTYAMVEVSQHSFALCSNLVQSSFSCSQSVLPGFAEFLQKHQQNYEDNGISASTDIELVPEVGNPNDINPGSSDASVDMYDFDSCFDGLSSDATSAVPNVEKHSSKNKNAWRSSSRLTQISEQDKFCCLPLEPREVDPLKWWKINRSIISELGKVTNKMLCSPPSSVGGNIYTPHRNRISPATGEKLMLLIFNFNYKKLDRK